MQTSNQYGYFPFIINCDVITKANKLKSDISILVTSLNNLLCKGYDLSTIVDSLKQVYFAKNIDNLKVQLVGPTSN